MVSDRGSFEPGNLPRRYISDTPPLPDNLAKLAADGDRRQLTRKEKNRLRAGILRAKARMRAAREAAIEAMKHGEAEPIKRGHEWRAHSEDHERCEWCGCLVRMPCLACQILGNPTEAKCERR